jgi:hypothetical protein
MHGRRNGRARVVHVRRCEQLRRLGAARQQVTQDVEALRAAQRRNVGRARRCVQKLEALRALPSDAELQRYAARTGRSCLPAGRPVGRVHTARALCACLHTTLCVLWLCVDTRRRRRRRARIRVRGEIMGWNHKKN